jgi:Tol biopolymer transport system component
MCLTFFLLSITPAHSAYPGGDGLVAFVGVSPGTDSRFDLYTVQPDGSGLQEIDDGASGEFDPAWSPDGRKLVFSRGKEVVVRDLLAGEEVVVARTATERPRPYFSPTGKRVIYADFTGRRSSIETVSATSGGTARVLASAPFGRGEGFSDPEYSPDGRRIVFVGTPPGKNGYGVWTMRRDGSRFHQLTHPRRGQREANDTFPSFSPDGRHVLLHRNDDESSRLVRVRADGKKERVLNFFVDFPTYSPSGQAIAGTAYPVDPSLDCSDIYAVGLGGFAGGGFLTDNCGSNPNGGYGAALPSWQPLP